MLRFKQTKAPEKSLRFMPTPTITSHPNAVRLIERPASRRPGLPFSPSGCAQLSPSEPVHLTLAGSARCL